MQVTHPLAPPSLMVPWPTARRQADSIPALGLPAGAGRLSPGPDVQAGPNTGDAPRPSAVKLPSASSAADWSAPASPSAADVLQRAPDPIADTIASLRRARQAGDANYAAHTLAAMVQLSKDGEKAAAAADAAATRLAAKSEPAGHKKQTREERRALVQNPWQPNYEALHLNDLFTLTGELTERMTDTMAHVVHLIKASTQLLCQQLAVHWHICVSWQPLAARACPCAHTQSFETQFLEIFNYYASLGQVRIIDDKLTLVRAQFNKLARATGIASSPSHPLLTEQAEDCFMAVADRVTNYYADYPHREHFITFPEFPEVVCRLAAVKYDWRPPDCPDDGEDDIAQPEALRAVPLANIYELPTANHYGVGPTAKPGTAAAQDSGQPLSPRTAIWTAKTWR